MYDNLLQNTSFHAILIAIDHDLREKVRKKGCFFCGCVLHIANYPRSPLGLTQSNRQYYNNRTGLCCGKCRRRTRVPSVRFMGRLRYPAPIFMLLSLLKFNATDRILTKVQRHLGIFISRRTWRRWRKWWNEYFKTTKFWKKIQGDLPMSHACEPFPWCLRSIFAGSFTDKMVSILKYLSPMTAGIDQAV